MSPKSGGRAQRRQRRNLIISVLVVRRRSQSGRSRPSFAAKWSPRLGLDLAGGVSVVYTAEGQHVSPGRPQRDGQHLEPARQRARRVGRAGADDGEEPDLGLDPRRDERPAGAPADRADGAHVLPPGRCAAPIPEAVPKGVEDQGAAARASRRSPPASRRRQLTAANLDVSPTATGRRASRRTTSTRPAVRGLPVDERREAELRQQHGPASPASAARATGATSPLRARARRR